MNQQRCVALALINLFVLYLLCLLVCCPNCSAEGRLQLSMPELSVDKKILEPLLLKPAAPPVSAPKKEAAGQPFQTLRNDAENLVKPVSMGEKKELPKESVSLPVVPGSISYQPVLKMSKEKWEEVRSSVEKAEQQTEEEGVVKIEGEEAGSSQEAVGSDETTETQKLRERIAQEERKRFEEEQRRISKELQRLKEKARNAKTEGGSSTAGPLPQEQPDVIIDEVPEVDGFKPQVGETVGSQQPAAGSQGTTGSRQTAAGGQQSAAGTDLSVCPVTVGSNTLPAKDSRQSAAGSQQPAVGAGLTPTLSQQSAVGSQQPTAGSTTPPAAGKAKKTLRIIEAPKNIIKGLRLPWLKKKSTPLPPASGGQQGLRLPWSKKKGAGDGGQGTETSRQKTECPLPAVGTDLSVRPATVGSSTSGDKDVASASVRPASVGSGTLPTNDRRQSAVGSPHPATGSSTALPAKKLQIGILSRLLDKINGPQDENLEKKRELFNIEPGKGVTGDLDFARLNISGNKSISANLGNAAYIDKARRDKKEAPPIASTGFGINQTLNVKLNGVVNDRIYVNVNYNDNNGQEQRTVNVDYKGSQTAAISEVNFGDVNLSEISSPNARFVSSNKQLFGIRAKGKYKKQYDVTMVMSKTKGKTTTQVLSKKDRKATELTHTSYVRYKYYQLLPLAGRGKKNITIHGVYLDNRNNNDVQRAISATATVTLSKVINSGTETQASDGLTKFERLLNQKDYTIDENGILTINRSISESYCLGVVFSYGSETYPGSYTGNAENPGFVWMIKPRSDLSGGGSYDVFECRNIYNLSDLQPGDVGVEMVDKQGKSFFVDGTNTISYARLFGLDNNSDGFVDSAFIDSNRHLLIFPDDTPFNLTDAGSSLSNGFLNATATAMATETLSKYSAKEMYKTNPDRTAISIEPTYNIKLSYKTSGRDAYMLQGWNIVENSEKILVNGVEKVRGIDYMVDYESGFLTFFSKPPDNADIKAEYEYASFGAEQQRNLVGARMQYKPNDNFCFGSTLIYNGAQGSADIPRIGSSPESLRVFGVDTAVNLMPLANKLWTIFCQQFREEGKDFRPQPLKFSVSLEGELAASRLDVNTFGYAMIDSMEGCKETSMVSTHEDNWQLGSLPDSSDKRIRLRAKDQPDDITLTGPYSRREEIRWKDKAEDEKQEEEVLYLDYVPSPQPGTWCVSVVSPLSRGAGAMDLRDYTDMELWIQGKDNALKVFIDLGVVSEDADGTGTVPGLEDKNKNGLLDKDEDVGWEFREGTPTVMVGAGNRKLDTEDLDGDGQISTQNHYFTLDLDRATTTTQGMGLNGFSRYTIPLKEAIKSSGEPNWELIKHIRIRLIGATATAGQVRIGDISLVKSRWNKGSVTTTGGAATITVSSLNSQDDPDKYQSIKDQPGFDDLYPNKEITREETMVVKYDIPEKNGTITPAGFVFRKFRQQNYNYYKSINLWLKNVSGTGTFFMKFGIDENNYIEYAFLLPDDSGWKKIGLDILELKNKMVEIIKGTNAASFSYATATSPFSEHPTVTRILGKPELTNIQYLVMGIQNEGTSTTINGEIWVNELHLSGAEPVSSDARRISVKTAYPGWGRLDLSNETVGGEFQRITDDKPSYNDATSDSISFAFDRIRILPVNGSYEKKLEQTDPTKINDVLRSDFGSRTTVSRQISISLKDLGSLKIGTNAVSSYLKDKLSPLAINASYNDKDINSQRQDDTSVKNSYTMAGDVNYKYTFPKKLLKIIPTGDSLVLSPVYRYSCTSNNERYPFERVKDKEDNSLTDDGKMTINFVPLRQKGTNNTTGKVILSGDSDITLSQTRKQLIKFGTVSAANYQLSDRKFGMKIMNVKCDTIPGVSPRLETEVHFDENNFRWDVNGKGLKDLVTSSRFIINGEIRPKEWINIPATATPRRDRDTDRNVCATNTDRNVCTTDTDKNVCATNTGRNVCAASQGGNTAGAGQIPGRFQPFSRLWHSPGQWGTKLLTMVTISPSFEVKANANYSNVDESISVASGLSRAYKDYYKSRIWQGIAAKEGSPGLLFGSGTSRSQSSVYKKFDLTSNWSIWKPLEKSSLRYTFSEEKNQTGVGLPASKNNTTYVLDLSMNMINALMTIVSNKTAVSTRTTSSNMIQTLPIRYARYLGSSTTIGSTITKAHEEDMSQIPTRITDRLDFNSNLRSTRMIGRRINSTFNMSWINTTSNKPNGLKDYANSISPELELRYNYDSAKSVGMLGRKVTLSRKLDTKGTIKMNFVHKEVDNKQTESKWDILTRITNDYELQKNTTSSMSFEIGYTHNGLEDNKDYYNYKWSGNVQFKF